MPRRRLSTFLSWGSSFLVRLLSLAADDESIHFSSSRPSMSGIAYAAPTAGRICLISFVPLIISGFRANVRSPLCAQFAVNCFQFSNIIMPISNRSFSTFSSSESALSRNISTSSSNGHPRPRRVCISQSAASKVVYSLPMISMGVLNFSDW